MAFRNWLAGLVMGVSGGFAVLIFPTLGLLVVGLVLIGVVSAGRRGAGVSGLLIGTGATTAALLLRAQMACQAFDAVANQGCDAPDITAYVVLGCGLAVAGGVGSVVALRRGRSGSVT